MSDDSQSTVDPLERSRLSRRELLRTAAVGVGAGALGLAGAEAAPAPGPRAKPSMRYRTLGRTGLRVSEVGFGGFPVDDPDVLLYALDHGINYIDTAHCYRGGASERAVGEALRGRRDRFVVATKWCPHHIGQPPRKANFLRMLDESLKRLQTDHVDVLFNHEVGENSDGLGVARLKNPEMHEAFAVAKKAGKARFLGVSGHDGDLMGVMSHAIDSGRFDVILCRYSFLDYPDQQKLIDKAHKANVGFVAMKTLAGAKGADLDRFKGRKSSFRQAALRWVLSNSKISNLIISIASRRQVDDYAAASGTALADSDIRELEDYAQTFSREVCRFCNACESSCPDDVRIADVLRFSMYQREYGWKEEATAAYAKLLSNQRAAHCESCAGVCGEACGYELPVRTLLVDAHRRLAADREEA